VTRLAATLALVLWAWSGTAAGQDADPQLDLYRRAYEAFQARDYTGSEALLRSALRIGDQNVLHLSLARALLYQGRCQEAVEELTAAESAPAVPTIGPGEVRARAAQYRADVERMCPGTVRVLCSPSDMRIRIGERREETCNSGRVTLPPGDYLVQGRVGGRTVRSSVAVRAMRESTVELLLASTAVEAPGDPPLSRDGPRPLRTFGWTSAIAGAVLLGAAVVLDTVVTADAIDGFHAAAQSGDRDAAGKKRDAETWQTATIVGYVSAGVLVVVGAVALATGGGGD
jgi:hypothetical protein